MTLDLEALESQRLTQQFLALVHIDSPPRKEGKIMQVLAPQFRALGCKVEFDQAHTAVGGEVGNLIATLPARRSNAHPIALSAHVDTVASTQGIRTVIENGIIRTDGATILGADDKAAVAAILEAIRHVVAHDIPHGEVQILLSICEEVGLLGAREMDVSKISARSIFVFDSSQSVGGIVVHGPSHDRLRAVIHGRKAHAGNAPETGVSAIQAAAIGISRMRLGRIDDETTANIGVIQGGEATNVVADRVEVLAEARSRNGASLEAQMNHMISCLQEGADTCKATVEIETLRHYSMFRLTEDTPVVRTAMAAARRIGRQPQLHSSGGGSDASIFNERGIPSVVLGIGYRNIHTHDECISEGDLQQTYQFAMALIQEAAACAV